MEEKAHSLYGIISIKIDYFTIFEEILNIDGKYWFKSHGNFAEFMDFAIWRRFSGGGSAINGAIPSSSRTDVVIADQTTRRLIVVQTTYYVHNLVSFLISILKTITHLVGC